MKYKIFIPLVWTLMLMVISSSGSIHAAPEQNYVIYSDDGFFKVRTDITKEEVFASGDASLSIQWAIDNIAGKGVEGGEVLMKAGEYPITNSISMKDKIWLHGEGESTLLYTNGRIKSAISVQDVSMAVLSDFSLTNKNNGLENPIGIWIDRSIHCKVLNVFISGFGRGIFNYGDACFTFINNNTLRNNKTNIDIANGGGVIGKWLPLLITENRISGGETGINCNALCTNINKNRISDLTGRGIVANGNSIDVRGNEINNVEGDFAIWGNGQEFNCTGNIIYDVKGGGIRTRTRWGSISNNTIRNCGTEDHAAIGILVVSDKDSHEGVAESKVIYNNTIVNLHENVPLKYGIKEDGIKNVILDNTIKNVEQQAILSEGEGTVVVCCTVD